MHHILHNCQGINSYCKLSKLLNIFLLQNFLKIHSHRSYLLNYNKALYEACYFVSQHDAPFRKWVQ